MKLSSLQLSGLRDRFHNLDLQKTADKDLFLHLAQFYVTDAEKSSRCAYDDKTGEVLTPGKKPQGNVTIGIGFNMSRGGARKEWQDAFQGTVDFDKAFSGRLRLTQQEVEDLFRHSWQGRVDEVRRLYGKS